MATSSRFSVRMIAAGLVIAVAGSLALTAFAREGGPHGGAHAGFMAHGPFFGRGLERMLDSVNATPEQRTQIQQITRAAAADLKAQREAGRALRERSMQLFTQPTVDANAAETLRQQMMAQHDQASKRVLQAMIDASRVLTPEQRSQLAQRMKQRHEMMQRHMRERAEIEGKQAPSK